MFHKGLNTKFFFTPSSLLQFPSFCSFCLLYAYIYIVHVFVSGRVSIRPCLRVRGCDDYNDYSDDVYNDYSDDVYNDYSGDVYNDYNDDDFHCC